VTASPAATLGGFYALMTALAWAVAVILFRRSGETVSPVALNFFKTALSMVLLAATLAVIGPTVPAGVTAQQTALLLVSGFIGIGVADTLFFASLNILGAGRSAIVDCLYSPFIVGFAVLLLHERLATQDIAGGLLIVSAVFMTGNSAGGSAALLRTRLLGIAYGAAAMAAMGLAIVMVKPIIEAQPVLWVTTVRVAGGLAGLCLWLAFDAQRRQASLASLRPHAAWRFMVPGSILGTYVAMLLWVSGFKYTSASVASMLNQTSTILVVVLAAIFLRERLDRARITAALLAFAGSCLVLM
jgi:drug/metabolite transporter (DMT)-like permease